MSVSQTSLLCHKDHSVPNVSAELYNKTDPIPYIVASLPCPRFGASDERFILSQIDENQNFYCYDSVYATDCFTDYAEVKMGNSLIMGCSFVECLNSDEDNSGQIMTFDETSNYIVCQVCPEGAVCDEGYVVGCRGDKLFVDVQLSEDYDESFCLSCETLGGEVCENNLISLCRSGYWMVNSTYCEKCVGSVICQSNNKKTCAEVNALQCVDNQVIKCQPGFILAEHEIGCVPCPDGAICDSLHYLGCQSDRFLLDNQCIQCGSENICDGKVMKSCEEVGGTSCVDNSVAACQETLVLSDNKQACYQCQQGQNFNGTECVQCSSNSLCFGDEVEIMCPMNELNVKQCQLGRIVVCDENYLPSADHMKCVDCRFYNVMESDGQNATKCYPVSYLSSQGCEVCPKNNLCDGINKIYCSSSNDKHALSCADDQIISCRNHYKPSLHRDNCDDCQADSVIKDCDGFKISNCQDGYYINFAAGTCEACSDIHHAVQCRDSQVIKCSVNYVPNSVGRGCAKCPDFYNVSCEDGIRPFCTETQWPQSLGFAVIGESRVVCYPCTNHTCNGSHITQCHHGYELTAFGLCATCYGNQFCDGLRRFDCSQTNVMHAKECANGFIFRCEEGFVLNRLFTECIPCPESADGFYVVCSGNQEVSCSKNEVASIGDLNENLLLIQCYDCPSGATCDGTQILACPEGFFKNRFECSQSIIDFCQHGEALRFCNCISNSVFFDNYTLKCDVEKKMPECTPTPQVSTIVIEDKENPGYWQDREMMMIVFDCACHVGGDIIAGWINTDEWYCIKVRNDHGDRKKYALLTAKSELNTAFAVKDSILNQIDSDGWLYTDNIFMKCDKSIIVDGKEISGGQCEGSRIKRCVGDPNRHDFILFNNSDRATGVGSMCLNRSVLDDPRIRAYHQIGDGLDIHYTPCEFSDLLFCNQPPEKEQNEKQCPFDHVIKIDSYSNWCRKYQNDYELFNGFNITRCLPGKFVAPGKDECQTCDGEVQRCFQDGLSFVDCSIPNNILNATKCSYGNIESCEPEFFSYESILCVLCPVSRTGLYYPSCDGSGTFRCYSSEVEKPFVYRNGYSCLPCPSGVVCDGEVIVETLEAEVISCHLGYRLSDDQLQCLLMIDQKQRDVAVMVIIFGLLLVLSAAFVWIIVQRQRKKQVSARDEGCALCQLANV